MASSSVLGTWREEVGRRLLNLDFRAEGDHPFEFKMRPIVMSDQVRVVASRHSPGFTFRDSSLVRDGNDSLAIVYPVQGRMRYSQRGKDVVLAAHDPVLIDTSVTGELGAQTSCNYVSLIFPRATLADTLERKRLENRRWPSGAPALRLLRSYVDALSRSNIPPFSELAETAHRHVLDLVRLAAMECSERDTRDVQSSGTIAEARVRVALGDIERSFRDPHLSEVEIALRQGISPRHLQRLFERAGLRFTDCVNELRLGAAFRVLSDPAFAERTVMQIAFDAGYSDVSHFNRLFRRRFGATPSEVRAARRR